MNQNQTTYHVRQTPGFFWPIILIGIGVIWLLANLGVLNVNAWGMIWRLWPVLFILMGIDILLRRTGVLGAVVSAALGLLVVAGVIVFLFVAQNNPSWVQTSGAWFGMPNLGMNELRTDHLADPLGGAHRAQVTIGFPGGDGAISALHDSGNLLEADLRHYGDLSHTVSTNNDTARVDLHSESGDSWPFSGIARQNWNVGLNPAAEYALSLDVGSGSCNFDLSQLTLSSLSLNHGSGHTELDLPKSGHYRFALEMGSGSVDVRVPQGLPVRVEYSIGSGSLDVNNLQRISGDNRNGVYTSSGYSDSGDYVIIVVSLGSGSVNID